MLLKRGQSAAGAAVLLAIIMGLIIVFILVLHPDERAALLGETSSTSYTNGTSSSSSKTTQTTLLQKSPGHLSYLKEKEIEKLIPSTHIYTETNSVILIEESQILIKNNLFSTKEEKLYFDIDDLNNTKDVYLDFSIDFYQGNLILSLNGREIFNKETNKITPIKIPNSILTLNNTLTLKVSSPGVAFWRTNQYRIKNLKVAAQVTDISHQQSTNQIVISQDELDNLQEATLKFSLDCAPQDKGKVEVRLNEYSIYSGTPDNCNELQYYTLPNQKIKNGSNAITFKTELGDYKINHASLKIKLKGISYPVYYFDIGKGYFTQTGKIKVNCGEVDGICPSSCDADTDKDCCFIKNSAGYWCDISTKNTGDRCVDLVETTDCTRCLSGYEDKNGAAPKNCAGYCGDDTDNYCPSNCKSSYDKDCCFAQTDNQFWCEDLPTNGVDFTCLSSVSSGECTICPEGYDGEFTSTTCPSKSQVNDTSEEKLVDGYDVILTFGFTDDKNKDAEVYINGYKTSFDTYKTEYSRNINYYVKPWSNSIKIVPLNSFDIRELKVELKSK